jgi:hypothetical protein
VESPESEILHPLSYQTYRDPVRIRIVKWMARRPSWLISIAIVVPVLAFSLSPAHDRLRHELSSRTVSNCESFMLFAAIFLPGALRQFGWFRLVATIAFAVIAFTLDRYFFEGEIQSVYELLAWYVPLVGLANWIVNPPHRWRSLLWILMLTTAVAFFVPIISVPLRREISLPMIGRPIEPSYPLLHSDLACNTRGGEVARG